MRRMIRVALGIIAVAMVGVPAMAQTTSDTTSKPTRSIIRETAVLCTLLPNSDIGDVTTPKGTCDLGFDDGGGTGADGIDQGNNLGSDSGNDATGDGTSTCSNKTDDSRKDCYPSSDGQDGGDQGAKGTRGTPIISCSRIFQEAEALCHGSASCISAAESSEKDCESRSKPSESSPTEGTPPSSGTSRPYGHPRTGARISGSSGGQRPTRTFVAEKFSPAVQKQRCESVRAGNSNYCESTVKQTMPSLYGMCVAKTQESYDTCVQP